MSDYWYEQRDHLYPEMIFLTEEDQVVKLTERVPGDATKWYVADLDTRGWGHWHNTVEAADLKQHLP